MSYRPRYRRPQQAQFVRRDARLGERTCPYCGRMPVGAINHATCDPCARAGVRMLADGTPAGLSARTRRDMGMAAQRVRLRLAVDAA